MSGWRKGRKRAGIRGKSGVWSRRLVIVLMLVCAGFAIPLTSILLGKVTAPRMLEQSLSEVAGEDGYRLLKLRRSGRGGGTLIDIELAGPEAPSLELVEPLKEAAEKKTGREVRLRVRTLLETESGAGE